MINRVIAVPRIYAEKLYHQLKNCWVISINCSDDEILYPTSEYSLGLKYDDIEPDGIMCLADEYNLKAMTYKDAEEVIQFLTKVHELETLETVYVHCTAGVCRSGAVAEFCLLAYEMNLKQFRFDNPNILPNRWNLNLLLSVFFDKTK